MWLPVASSRFTRFSTPFFGVRRLSIGMLMYVWMKLICRLVQSLREAAIYPEKAKISQLNLRCSEDLLCKNLMCEKFDIDNTQPCICKLSRFLSTHQFVGLKVLDLSANNLCTVPLQVCEELCLHCK